MVAGKTLAAKAKIASRPPPVAVTLPMSEHDEPLFGFSIYRKLDISRPYLVQARLSDLIDRLYQVQFGSGRGAAMSEKHEHGPVDWKIHGVKVIPGDQLDPNTAQTPGMDRAAAINLARVGAQKIWAGT